MKHKPHGTAKGKATPRTKATGQVSDLDPKRAGRVRGGASGDPLKGLNVDKGGEPTNTLGWTWRKGG